MFLALGRLDLLGFHRGGEQPEAVRQAIRWMTALSPPLFLLVGVAVRWRYPLTRRAHTEIRAALVARDAR